MGGRSSKNKGDNYERELAAYINESTSIQSFRAPLSGGGHVGLSGGADLMGTPHLFVEAKRVERLNFHAAMNQAETNKIKTNSPEHPIVITRRNRMKTGESLCVLRLDDFLEMYKVYLEIKGENKIGHPDEEMSTMQET